MIDSVELLGNLLHTGAEGEPVSFPLLVRAGFAAPVPYPRQPLTVTAKQLRFLRQKSLPL